MKETIGMTHYQNAKNKSKRLRKPIADKKFKSEETEIAKQFNNFLTVLVRLFQLRFLLQVDLLTFFRKNSTNLPSRYLKIDKLKHALFSLKISKSPSADKIIFNVIKNYFGDFSDIVNMSLIYLCKLQCFRIDSRLQKRTLHLRLLTLPKLVISVLPCVSKILKCMLYNMFDDYLVGEIILRQVPVPKKLFHRTYHCSVSTLNL